MNESKIEINNFGTKCEHKPHRLHGSKNVFVVEVFGMVEEPSVIHTHAHAHTHQQESRRPNTTK